MDISRILQSIKQRINDVIKNPKWAFDVSIALLRGCYYLIKYNLFYNNIKIEFPFKVYAPVKIIGKGSVFIGKGCSVYKNVFRGLTIVTLSPIASVIIGEKCGLGGLTIRCQHTVQIRNKTITANSLIQDVFLLNSLKFESYKKFNKSSVSEKIDIGENVWVCGDSVILKGSTVGEDSVVSLGALCYEIDIESYCLASSNPVKRTLPINKLMKLKG